MDKQKDLVEIYRKALEEVRDLRKYPREDVVMQYRLEQRVMRQVDDALAVGDKQENAKDRWIECRGCKILIQFAKSRRIISDTGRVFYVCESCYDEDEE